MEELKIFITSDWHFNHDREFVWKERGFSSVEEMNEEIIRRHNSIVQPHDLVYVLGDNCLGGGSEEMLAANKELIKRLNGKLIMINGNHDTDRRIEMYKYCRNVFDTGRDALRFKYKKYHFFLCHFPMLTANYDEGPKEVLLNLHGHTHQKTNFTEGSWSNYHVGMDSHNCYPVLLDNIIEEIKAEYNRLKEIKEKI